MRSLLRFNLLNLMDSQKVLWADGFVKSPSSRHANLVAQSVLAVRRSDREMKRNAEMGFFTMSSNLRRARKGRRSSPRKGRARVRFFSNLQNPPTPKAQART
jgi:hypothetical protein